MINGAVYPLDEVEKMGYAEFGLRARINMPKRLYKYFPNMRKEVRGDSGEVTSVNYSLDALKSNCVYLNCPDQFDDVYDSDINIPWEEYSLFRLNLKQIFNLSFHISANGDKSWILRLFRHLSYRVILGISW